MFSSATLGAETRARKRKRERRRDANGGEAISGLLNDIVVTHVLRSEHFDDPADLARLPAVSRAMRDAVAATGLAFEELDGLDATIIGCLSAVQRLQRQGRLLRQEYLCQAAARAKPRRIEGAARERLPVELTHVLACGNGRTSRGDTVGVHERMSVGREDMLGGGKGRAPRCAAVVARERL